MNTPLPGSFSLAITGLVVEGILSTGSGETYAISGRPEELVFTRVEAKAPFLCPVVPSPVLNAGKRALAEVPRVEAASEVDVLVVYTAAAKGGPYASSAGILNSIRRAIGHTNQAMTNSGVPLTLNLAGVGEVTLQESGSCEYDLSQSYDSATLPGGAVEQLRRDSGADLVSLWTADSDCGGIAFVLTNPNGSPSTSLSITVLGAGNSYPIFAHEIGHNLGASDDRGNAGSVRGLFPYSYGFQNTTVEPRFRDLMGYECAGSPCPRRPYSSTPNVLLFGRPIGVAAPAADSADAAATFRISGPIVANYRPRVINPNPPPFLRLNTSEILPPAEGGQYTVTVESNVFRQASSDSSWLPFTAAVTGDGTLTIPVPKVTEVGARRARITVRGEGVFEYIDITQNGVSVQMEPRVITLGAEAAGGQIRATLSQQSFASNASSAAGAGWLTVSPMTGTGSRTLQCSVQANTTGAVRSAWIKIGDASTAITQSAALIRATGPIMGFPAAGGALPVPVFASAANGAPVWWTATARQCDRLANAQSGVKPGRWNDQSDGDAEPAEHGSHGHAAGREQTVRGAAARPTVRGGDADWYGRRADGSVGDGGFVRFLVSN